MNEIKKHLGLIILTVVAILFDIFAKELLFTLLLAYGLFIKYLLSDTTSNEIRKVLAVQIWAMFALASFLLYYSNNQFPRGPMIDTGDVVCENDDRGPCHEKYIENTSNLNVPDWVKFFKGSEGSLLWMGLLLAGIVASKTGSKNEEN